MVNFLVKVRKKNLTTKKARNPLAWGRPPPEAFLMPDFQRYNE